MAAKKAQRICNPPEAPLAFSLQIMLSTSQAEPGEQLGKNGEICVQSIPKRRALGWEVDLDFANTVRDRDGKLSLVN